MHQKLKDITVKSICKIEQKFLSSVELSWCWFIILSWHQTHDQAWRILLSSCQAWRSSSEPWWCWSTCPCSRCTRCVGCRQSCSTPVSWTGDSPPSSCPCSELSAVLVSSLNYLMSLMILMMIWMSVSPGSWWSLLSNFLMISLDSLVSWSGPDWAEWWESRPGYPGACLMADWSYPHNCCTRSSDTTNQSENIISLCWPIIK